MTRRLLLHFFPCLLQIDLLPEILVINLPALGSGRPLPGYDGILTPCIFENAGIKRKIDNV